MLVVAQQVLQSPELTGQIFSHLRDSRALQRAGLACQLWYLKASRFLWAVRRQLFGLEHQIPAVYQKAIASFIRHLDLSLIDQLWEGSPSSMPALVGLQTAILNTKALHHQSGVQCLQKMLVGFLRELCIDTSTDDDLGSLKSDTCWFRSLRRSKAQGASHMEEDATDRDELLVWGDGVELETEYDIGEQLGAEAEITTAAAYLDVINEPGRNIAESGCSKSYWSPPARGRRE
jgi:hypothetical protein